MKLIHYTSKDYIESFKEYGMNRSKKHMWYKEKPYRVIDDIIDSSEYADKLHQRSAAQYFIFPVCSWASAMNDVDLGISVDIEDLDVNKLYVANMRLSEYIYSGVVGKHKIAPEKLLCMHYWNDFFPFEFYIKNWKRINNIYIKNWGTTYVPEVLYFEDIHPGNLDYFEPILKECDNGIIHIPEYEKYKTMIKRECFKNPNGIHGMGHAKRVLYLALLLSYSLMLSEKEKKILAYCSAYHDVGRVGDSADFMHGIRSVTEINEKGYIDNFSTDEREIIQDVIKHHCIKDSEFNYKKYQNSSYNVKDIFYCLKDADALDRVRFGNDLNIKYLRLEASPILYETAKQLYYSIP